MFKFKTLLIVLVILIAFGPVVSGQTRALTYDPIVWGNGTVTSDSLVLSDLLDTTATFKFKQGKDFPDYASFMRVVIETAGSDSSSVVFNLDLSNDETYWYSWGVMGGDTLTSIATAASVQTGSNTFGVNPASTSLSLFPTYNYGRIRVKAVTADGDTATCKLQMVRGFIQY